MRKLGLVVLWMLGSICAIVVAWTGMSVVSNKLIVPPAAGLFGLDGPRSTTGDDPDPSRTGPTVDGGDPAPPGPPTTTRSRRSTAGTVDLSGSVGTLGSGGAGGTFSTGGTGGSRPTSPDPAGPIPTPGPSGSGAPASGTTTVGPPGNQAPSPAPTISPTSATTTATTTTTPTTSPPPTSDPRVSVTSSALSFSLLGGSATVSFAPPPGRLTLLSILPAPGYTLRLETDPAGRTLAVEFIQLNVADPAVSRIDAWWDGGPQYNLNEFP